MEKTKDEGVKSKKKGDDKVRPYISVHQSISFLIHFISEVKRTEKKRGKERKGKEEEKKE